VTKPRVLLGLSVIEIDGTVAVTLKFDAAADPIEKVGATLLAIKAIGGTVRIEGANSTQVIAG